VRRGRVLGLLAAAVVVACHSANPAAAPSLAARIDAAARTCAKLASCAHAHDAPRDRDPAACVDAWIARAPAEREPVEACVVAAKDCAEVDACGRDRGDAATAGYCRAHAGVRTGCEGSRLVTCSQDDPAESSAIDCAAFGATCGDLPQAGGLMVRACVSAALCPAGAPEVRCDGPGAVVTCHEGAVERAACPGAARCEEHQAKDGAASAVCEPPSHRHCDTVGKRWCEQGSLVQCQPHGPYGEPVVTDCASLGLACDEHAEPGAACVAPGPRSCEHAAPRCEGDDMLTFCAAGRRFRLSCRALGLGACDPDAHGVDAACSPAGSGAPAPLGPPPAHP